jgi:hypothetical protein
MGIKVTGCGLIDRAQTWNASGTALQFKVKVPLNPSEFSATITIDNGQATASATSGWPSTLSGNHGGGNSGKQNGEGPNGNDYTWNMACDQNLDLMVDGTLGGKPVKGQVLGDPATDLTCSANGTGRYAGNIVHWQGTTSDTKTPISGEFDTEYGTWPLGNAVGDQSIAIDEVSPTYKHIGSVSGTITQNKGGGSIDAVAADGADSVHVTGTWTCPSTASPSP